LRSDTGGTSVNMKLLTDTLATIAATAPAKPTPAVHTTPVIPEGKTLVDSDELMRMKIDRAKAEERERITKEGTGPRPGMIEVRANKHTKGNRLLCHDSSPYLSQMSAEQYANLRAAHAKEEAKRELMQETKEEMVSFREKEGAERVCLINHMMQQSTKAMDNAFSMGKVAQASSSPLARGHLLNHRGGEEEPTLIPHPRLAALTMDSGSPYGSPGKGGGKGGKGKGKPTQERRLAPDGMMYTKAEFQSFFYGLTEWEEAGDV
jgi:hypothetical protein